MSRLIPVDYELLLELADYFEDRADVRDGPFGEPVANSAMRLHQALQALLDAEDARPKDDSLWEVAKDLMGRRR